jgi:RNA polymerase sigma-70 factor (ECF subfamily)
MLTLTGKPFVASRKGEAGSGQGTSDEALIGTIAAGDRRAMQALYARHNVRLYRFVLRLTNDSSLAEDLVSEVFIDVWRGAKGFKAKSQVSTWMLAIARHKALSALRRRSDAQLDEDAAMAIADPADDVETIVDKRDRSVVVQPACRSFQRNIGKCSISSTITKNRWTRSPRSSGRPSTP